MADAINDMQVQCFPIPWNEYSEPQTVRMRLPLTFTPLSLALHVQRVRWLERLVLSFNALVEIEADGSVKHWHDYDVHLVGEGQRMRSQMVPWQVAGPAPGRAVNLGTAIWNVPGRPFRVIHAFASLGTPIILIAPSGLPFDATDALDR